MCDECDSAYHLECLSPPLDEIPDVDEWCVTTRDKCKLFTFQGVFCFMASFPSSKIQTLNAGLEIRVDRWPESTENPVGPPIRAVRWSARLTKSVGFFGSERYKHC